MQLKLGPPHLEIDFNFDIPGTINEVAIFLSGGLDSAALLCLVLTELKDTQRLDTMSVNCVTVFKNDGSMNYSDTIVKAVSAKFNKKIEHINYFPNDEDSIAIGRVGFNSIKEYCKNKGSNTKLYLGINKMAPDNIRPFTQTLKIVYSESKYFEAPFLNLCKPQILDIFFKLNCEGIIEFTHSCTVNAEGVCRECYSCAERNWGFTDLGKVDPAIDIG